MDILSVTSKLSCGRLRFFLYFRRQTSYLFDLNKLFNPIFVVSCFPSSKPLPDKMWNNEEPLLFSFSQKRSFPS